MLIVPLTSIKQQILVDCGKRGISVLDGDQVLPVLNITHFSAIIEQLLRALSTVPSIRPGERASEAADAAHRFAGVLGI